jgi:heptosyltransferase-2
MTVINTDCRHFRGDRPCAPHKATGVECSTCTEAYDPVQQRVLIVKLAAMGDVLRTTSLLPAIHRRWPGSHVTWVTSPASLPLLQRNPAIDRVLAFSGNLPLELQTERFDVVLNPDAALDSCALAHAARARTRVGFAFDRRGAPVPLTPGAEAWYAMGLSDTLKRDNRRTYQDLMADVLEVDWQREPPSLHLDEQHLQRGRDLRAANPPGSGGSVVGLNTGAGGRWKYKRWTEDGYVELVRALGNEGHRVFLLGGPEELERNARLVEASEGAAVDTGCDNSIPEFAGIVDTCDAVVTGDTLAMHVAIARNVPTIVLFGPTSLHEIDVFERGDRIAAEGKPCLCCYLPDCDVRPTCMDEISTERVLSAVLPFLRLPAARS